MTGLRTEPISRRRVRGAHKGLKRMLVEGMGDAGRGQRTWKSFSGSMVRQAVEEAVASLPPRQKQLIKLAYFSDLSNREIAQGLGITLSSVERGLRDAIARVSEHVERGRAAGRKAIYALAMFLGGRWLSEMHRGLSPSAQQWVKAGVLVVLTATAGGVVSLHPAAPAQLNHVEKQSVPAIVAAQPSAVVRHSILDLEQSTNTAVRHVMAKTVPAGGIEVAAPASVGVPAVRLPVSVKLPPIPPVPILHGLLGA